MREAAVVEVKVGSETWLFGRTVVLDEGAFVGGAVHETALFVFRELGGESGVSFEQDFVLLRRMIDAVAAVAVVAEEERVGG